MNADLNLTDDTIWLRELTRHVHLEEVPALRAAFEGVSGFALAGPARLLALQIEASRSAVQNSGSKSKSSAKLRLEVIRAGLESAFNRNESELSRTVTNSLVGSHAKAPLPAQADISTLTEATKLAYQVLVRRTPGQEEINIWLTNFSNGLTFAEFFLMMNQGQEAKDVRARSAIAPEMADADFIQSVYRHIEGRGALPAEIEMLRKQLDTGSLTRASMVQTYFSSALARDTRGAEPLHDGLSSAVMGTGHTLTLAEWQAKAQDTAELSRARSALVLSTPFKFSAEPGVEITAIASLFRGGDFIEQFMDNITSQSCFDRHCELVIVDAASPENEAQTIERYLARHPGVRYKRMDSRVGIYEAWNIGVQMARGQYLTNTNLDDLRRRDSLEIQAGALQELPFVDVVYQDFYYSFDPNLAWKDVAAFGYKSDLPVVTPYNMLRFNSPHNAPMWRKSLHDELGLFDASFKSAGDYEFWMRCLVAGKTFYKVNEPHVVYYQNPKGLSTRSDTRGLIEAYAILRKYAPKLIANAFTAPLPDFAHGMLHLSADACGGEQDRGQLAQSAMLDLARRSKSAVLVQQ